MKFYELRQPYLDEFEGSGGEPSADQVSDPISDPISDPAPQAIKVKFNHDEIEIPYEEAVQHIQKGMNYDKAVDRAKREAAEQSEAKYNRLMDAIKQYGYPGDPDAAADALMAQSQGISQEEARAQREAWEAEDAKYNQLQSDVQAYKSIAIEKLKSDDLAKLKSAYPDNKEVQKLKSIDELGGEFFSLLSATHDPELAYDALQAKNARHTKPAPPDIGAVNSSSGKEKDFYTSAEVDKLTDKDFDNPKIMEAVRKSMLKWK